MDIAHGLFCLQCPAIDYTRHTLDGAASLLNSNKYFPSRLVYVYSVEKSQIRITFPGYKLYVIDSLACVETLSQESLRHAGQNVFFPKRILATYIQYTHTKFHVRLHIVS